VLFRDVLEGVVLFRDVLEGVVSLRDASIRLHKGLDVGRRYMFHTHECMIARIATLTE